MNRFAGTALLVLTILLGAVTTASAARDFWNPASSDSSQQFPLLPPPLDGNVQRDDTPNDPGYDRAEPDDEDGATTTNIYDERFDLFGFPSSHTALTLYREGPNALKKQISGFNAAGAWKISRGSPEVAIAVLDTGIKWDREGIRLQVRLNRNELPQPQTAGGSSCAYDCNGDGAFNVADYNDDPRISHTAGPHGSAQIDAEDLITVFSDGTDSDANGYVDDIAGWDFFDNDNNPYDASSYFAASGHGSGRMTEAVERGDDGRGDRGMSGLPDPADSYLGHLRRRRKHGRHGHALRDRRRRESDRGRQRFDLPLGLRRSRFKVRLRKRRGPDLLR